MKKLCLVLLIIGICFLASTNIFAQEKMFIRLAHDQAEDTPYQVAAVTFKKIVEEKTNGQVQIDIIPNAALGDEISCIDSVRIGDLKLSIACAPNSAAIIPEVGFFGVSYLFENYDHFKKAMTDEILKREVRRIVKEKDLGIIPLGFLTTGIRTLYAKKAVRNIEDLHNLKMRVMASPVEAQVWKTLGTLPVSITFQEVYSAMQTGVIEGAENTPLVYIANHHYEVAPFLNLTMHQFMVSFLWANEDFMNQLPQDIREIIEEAAKEMTVICIDKTEEDEKKILEEMPDKYGVTVVRDVNRQEFIDRLAPLQDSIAKKLGTEAILDRIRELKEN